MEQQRVIRDLVLQPKFLLQEGFRDRTGKWHRAIHYIADFQYVEGDQAIVEVVKGRDVQYAALTERQIVIEEVKGRETAVYRIKKKLFLAKFPDVDYRVLKKGDF